MSGFEALSAIIVVGLITYASRAGLVLALADRTPSPKVERALRNVGPAVLSALVVTLLAGSEGAEGVELPEVAAVLAGAIAAWKTRNLIATIVAGMATLWVVAALI